MNETKHRLYCGRGIYIDRDSLPSTAECAVAKMISFLSEGEATRSQFLGSIEGALDAVAELQRRVEYYVRELHQLEDDIAFSAPPMTVTVSHKTAEFPDVMEYFRIRIGTQFPDWCIAVRDQQREIINGHTKASKHLRWRTYLNFARELRKRLNEGFAQIERNA